MILLDCCSWVGQGSEANFKMDWEIIEFENIPKSPSLASLASEVASAFDIHEESLSLDFVQERDDFENPRSEEKTIKRDWKSNVKSKRRSKIRSNISSYRYSKY